MAFWPVLAIAPTSVALAVRGVGGRRARGAAALAALGTALGLGLFRWQLARLFVEEPAFVVERRIGPFEVRRYPAAARAETRVSGLGWRGAIDEGFRRLFGYIAKGNRAEETISMTAPVTTSRAPETSERADDVIVSFMMPAGRGVTSLPAPDDGRIQLVDSAPRRVAALKYAGGFDAERTRAKQRELYEEITRLGLKPIGDPGFAAYDPPTTLPFLRRNEVWIEVAPDAS